MVSRLAKETQKKMKSQSEDVLLSSEIITLDFVLITDNKIVTRGISDTGLYHTY